MPEIPEMELYKNNLNKTITNKKILQVIVHRAKSLNLQPAEFHNALINHQIQLIERKGKFLIFSLANEQYLLTHMMLDGRLYFLESSKAEAIKDDLQDPELLKKTVKGLPGKPSVIFTFEDGSILFFCRLTLGYLHFISKLELNESLKDLGIDPLSESFTEKKFKMIIKGKRGMIKPWLINQKYLAGVGNAYSNEALFEAGILPTRQIANISEEEKAKLSTGLVKILKLSIATGGDMEEPFTPDDTFTGGFNPHFKVYEREGKDCKVCGETIIREEVGGRNAFFCPNCQK